MRAKHREHFSHPVATEVIVEPGPHTGIAAEDGHTSGDSSRPASNRVKAGDEAPALPPDLAALAGYLPLLNRYIDSRIQKALEDERPRIIEGMKQAIIELATQRGSSNPTSGSLPPAAAAPMPGSAVTPLGAQLIGKLLSSGETTDMERLAKMLSQARAISEVINPPTMWDRVMQNVVVRSLAKSGLLTQREAKDLEKRIGEIA